MDQAVAKKALQDLVKNDNKLCCDCANPNPQWASLGFAVFLCLQCAGTHRGFGVHISFVRSISMDTWQPDQLRRMQIGGNAAFKAFMAAYAPAEQGGYKAGAAPYEVYHCWAASQYREKLDAEIAGREWAQSAPPPPPLASADPAGLRKSRASTRSNTGTSLRSDSASPASFAPAPSTRRSAPGTPDPDPSQKAANESFFSGLGQANAARPADLPPSQGGRYTGFGSTPSPPPGAGNSAHPAHALSSAAAPTLGELQADPAAALSKGWTLLSAALAGASRAVAENVLQPAAARARDPALQASVRGAVGAAARAGGAANAWGKSALGVDVAGGVGGVVGAVADRLGPGPAREGYGAVGAGVGMGGGEGEETSGLYHDDDDDLFQEYREGAHYDQPVAAAGGAAAAGAGAPQKKNNDWDDEWKDF
ncbi:ArfGap-domain-containing protein [Mycena belliarum]|uniref:ArfGap-domain-containing protein n=1 Tax=Mycena belliarum TaxID=1033014 RepID=A0AAD6UCY6_9AGAR|nr:ArfGap-domain-containing protein [Mycena belliae]